MKPKTLHRKTGNSRECLWRVCNICDGGAPSGLRARTISWSMQGPYKRLRPLLCSMRAVFIAKLNSLPSRKQYRRSLYSFVTLFKREKQTITLYPKPNMRKKVTWLARRLKWPVMQYEWFARLDSNCMFVHGVVGCSSLSRLAWLKLSVVFFFLTGLDLDFLNWCSDKHGHLNQSLLD